jgi:hypothetical protein
MNRWRNEHAALDELRSSFGVDANGVVDEGKLSSFITSVTRPRADARVAALRNLAGNDAKLLGIIDDVAEVQGAANLVRDQLMREQAGGMDLELLAGVAGHGIGGGFAGALIGRGVAQGFTRPLHAALSRYKMAAQVQRVHGYIRDAFDGFVGGRLAKAGDAVRRSGVDRKLAPLTQSMLDGDREERRNAVQARIAEVMATTPDVLTDRIASATELHAQHIPDVSAVVQQRLAEAHAFLLSVIPQPLATAGAGGGLVPSLNRGIIPDRDIRRFAVVDAAIQDPLRLVDDMRAGRMPDPAAVLAVQTIFPALWGRMVGELSNALAANPTAVGWGQARSLAVTMGLSSHPAFATDTLNLQQAIAKTAKAPPTPVSRGLAKAANRELSGATPTLNDHLMERPARR